MHMAVHDGLSRSLPGVDADIEPHHIRILSANAVSLVLQETLDGGSLGVVQVEVVRDMAAGDHQRVARSTPAKSRSVEGTRD